MNDVSGPIFTAGRKFFRCRLRVKTYHLATGQVFFFSFFFLFLSFFFFFFFFCFCLINGIQKTDILKSGLVRNHSLDGTVEIRFTMPLPALMVWRKTTGFFLILGIFPMFWRVMICCSRPYGRPCLLNLSAKASGVVPVLITIEMSGLA